MIFRQVATSPAREMTQNFEGYSVSRSFFLLPFRSNIYDWKFCSSISIFVWDTPMSWKMRGGCFHGERPLGHRTGQSAWHHTLNGEECRSENLQHQKQKLSKLECSWHNSIFAGESKQDSIPIKSWAVRLHLYRILTLSKKGLSIPMHERGSVTRVRGLNNNR